MDVLAALPSGHRSTVVGQGLSKGEQEVFVSFLFSRPRLHWPYAVLTPANRL